MIRNIISHYNIRVVSSFLLPLSQLKLYDMKYVKILFAIALVFTMCSAFSMKKGQSDPVYAFGVSASFTDSVVYFTDIQVLDSAEVNKDGFLVHRELYSYQLKNYLEDNQLQQNSISMIYFSENRKKLEKEAAKILNKYKRNNRTTVSQIDLEKFRFTKPEE